MRRNRRKRKLSQDFFGDVVKAFKFGMVCTSYILGLLWGLIYYPCKGFTSLWQSLAKSKIPDVVAEERRLSPDALEEARSSLLGLGYSAKSIDSILSSAPATISDAEGLVRFYLGRQ